VCVGGAEHVHVGEHHPGELGLLPHHQGADGGPHAQGARQGTGEYRSYAYSTAGRNDAQFTS